MSKGYLLINVYGEVIANPINEANITILKDNNEIYSTTTNINGQTDLISLDTVSDAYSENNQDEVRPYETYDVIVTSLGMTPTRINGVQIFDNVVSIQNIYLTSLDTNQNEEIVNIDPNNLWENNNELMKNVEIPNNNGIATAILKQVVIPQNIIVHDGIPSNSTAPNYTVPFIDYIKNVASSEIYSTWPEETIKANVLAIISFTLNRIYTEWYLSRGYDFTITSSSSYDQKYSRNGTIFEPISRVVDDIFNNYIRYGIRMEPYLSPYRSETSTSGILSQWGSKDLGDQGYDALQILRYYYGNNINIYEAELLSTGEYPYSYSKTLRVGDCSSDVYLLQTALNYIHGSFPGIPLIENPSGYYNEATQNSVKTFQQVFSLPQTGEVNLETWYKISYILTAVKELTETNFK